MEDKTKIQKEMAELAKRFEELTDKLEKLESEELLALQYRNARLEEIEDQVEKLNQMVGSYVRDYYDGDYNKFFNDIAPEEEHIKCKIPSVVYDLFFL